MNFSFAYMQKHIKRNTCKRMLGDCTEWLYVEDVAFSPPFFSAPLFVLSFLLFITPSFFFFFFFSNFDSQVFFRSLFCSCGLSLPATSERRFLICILGTKHRHLRMRFYWYGLVSYSWSDGFFTWASFDHPVSFLLPSLVLHETLLHFICISRTNCGETGA